MEIQMKTLIKIYTRIMQVFWGLLLALPLLVVVIVLAADYYLTPNDPINYDQNHLL